MEHEEMKEEGVWPEEKVQQLTANGWDRWWLKSEHMVITCILWMNMGGCVLTLQTLYGVHVRTQHSPMARNALLRSPDISASMESTMSRLAS